MAQIVGDLAAPSEEGFYTALKRLRQHPLEGTHGGDFALEVALELQRRPELTLRVQAERFLTILRHLELDSAGLATLALRGHTLGPGLKNAIATVLPPGGRRRLAQTTAFTERKGIADHQLQARIEEPPLLQGGTAASKDRAKIERRFSTVVLLSNTTNQDANRSLLTKKGFTAYRWSSVADLESELSGNSDICACVIDDSFLGTLDKQSQEALFRCLAGYSRFMWIRVHEGSHFLLSHEDVWLIVERVRCLRHGVPASALSFQPEANLRDSELVAVELARSRLGSCEQARFVPRELTAEQSDLLIAAASLHAQGLKPGSRVEVESVETLFLQGGFTPSKAHVALLRVNQAGRPVVAKVAQKDLILDEMRRFTEFIQPWDNNLNPELYTHCNAAVIIFGLVTDENDPSLPAPMLYKCLADLWNSQYFATESADKLTQRATDLARGIGNAARALARLNRCRPNTIDLRATVNPSTSALAALAETGVDWGLGAEMKEHRTRAKSRLAKLETAGIVHGDVHLRNILLRGDLDAHLIDYAASGPGHPAVDLVRLELALYLGMLRQLEAEDQCVKFQKRFSIELATTVELEGEFPALYGCYLNVACLRGCVAARDQVIQVLTHHGGDIHDYHAVKYLVALQSLAMLDRETGLTRSVIRALSQAPQW